VKDTVYTQTNPKIWTVCKFLEGDIKNDRDDNKYRLEKQKWKLNKSPISKQFFAIQFIYSIFSITSIIKLLTRKTPQLLESLIQMSVSSASHIISEYRMQLAIRHKYNLRVPCVRVALKI